MSAEGDDDTPLLLDRVSVPQFSRGPDSGGLYSHMLREDVSMRVFPIGGGDAFALEPDDEALQEMVSDAFAFGTDSRGHDSGDLSHHVCEWGRWCASRLVEHERELFEISFWLQGTERKPVGFAVIPLAFYDVEERNGRFIQHVSAGPGRRPAIDVPREEIAARDVEIPKERIVELRPSPELRHIVRFPTENREPFPRFMLPSSDGTIAVKADMRLFRRTESVALGEATRDSGWNARGTFNELQTEYYLVWREIRFARFLMKLRTVVAAGANAILRHAGARLGFSATLRLQNVPDDGDLRWAEEHLAAGDVAANELLDRVWPMKRN